VISLHSLVKKYRIGKKNELCAVEDVTLEIASGEFTAIVGHSGSGKTTLLSLMGGLTAPDSGSAIVDGTSLWEIDDDRLAIFRNRTIGFIYQFASLLPNLTILENVLLPTMYGDRKKNKKDAVKLLHQMGLADKAESFPAELSGGQQRRAAIARAFINDPKIILADEPTGDLDEDTEAEVLGFFRHIHREHGTTFVIVTHSSDLAATASCVYRMTNGRLMVA